MVILDKGKIIGIVFFDINDTKGVNNGMPIMKRKYGKFDRKVYYYDLKNKFKKPKICFLSDIKLFLQS